MNTYSFLANVCALSLVTMIDLTQLRDFQSCLFRFYFIGLYLKKSMRQLNFKHCPALYLFYKNIFGMNTIYFIKNKVKLLK
jgi:hypothetical protein